jgi:hypothetical protein
VVVSNLQAQKGDMSKLKARTKMRESILRLIKAVNNPAAVEVTVKRADLELVLAICAGKGYADVETIQGKK